MGRNRRIIRALSVCAAGLSIFWNIHANGAVKTNTTSLTGEQITSLILSRLSNEGLDGAPFLDAARVFPPCETTPDVNPMFGSWYTVAVSCGEGPKWRYAIRTNLKSRPKPVPVSDFRSQSLGDVEPKFQSLNSETLPQVADLIEVVALKKSVLRDETIRANDVLLVAVPARNALGAFFNPIDVVGRRVKTAISARQPVMARNLQPLYLVKDDSEVLITSSASGIRIDMLGVALENGQFGDWINVRNISSGKTIKAKVVDEKKVRVTTKK